MSVKLVCEKCSNSIPLSGRSAQENQRQAVQGGRQKGWFVVAGSDSGVERALCQEHRRGAS